MKKKQPQLANTRFSSRQRRNSPSRFALFWLGLLRVFFWLLLAAFLIFSIGALVWLIKLELFDRNPHFTIRNINIQVHGDMPETEIAEKLKEFGVRRNETNLFTVSLPRLRQQIEQWSDMPSRRILIRRELPDTLEIDIFEREPIAQIFNRQGPLIDNEAVMLPPRRTQPQINLPLITRIRGNIVPEIGEQADDPRLLAPIALLRRIEDNPSYNQLFEISAIQLEFPTREQMLLRLRREGPFIEGAQIVMPLSEQEIPNALRRLEAIALDRLDGQKMTGFVDASIRQNAPVLPQPRY